MVLRKSTEHGAVAIALSINDPTFLEGIACLAGDVHVRFAVPWVNSMKKERTCAVLKALLRRRLVCYDRMDLRAALDSLYY